MESGTLVMRGWEFRSPPPFPVPRELKGVVGDQELICIKCHKKAILGSCTVNMLSNSIRDSFLEKETIHQISTMGLAIVVHYHNDVSNCCSVRDNYSSENFIPASGTVQSSNSNDAEIGVPINGDASTDHHSPR
ncbi:hypothetical protein TNCV_974411 [Trichonephila clavipes]|nr:hypothetical protein TNCV_974411 [Trichonephila clavipes]